jgi:hypothetical protein
LQRWPACRAPDPRGDARRFDEERRMTMRSTLAAPAATRWIALAAIAGVAAAAWYLRRMPRPVDAEWSEAWEGEGERDADPREAMAS